jgi:hypothetical protein
MIGQILGRYLIVEEIGAGGMGVGYRALEEQQARNVALQALPAGLLVDEAARKRSRGRPSSRHKRKRSLEANPPSGLSWSVRCSPRGN